MKVFSDPAIEGFLYCLYVQHQPPENAYAELLEVANSLNIPDLLTWTYEDVHVFYTKLSRGEFHIQESKEIQNEYRTLKGFIYCLVWLEVHERAAPRATASRTPGMQIFSYKDVDLVWKGVYDGKYTMLEWKGVEYKPEHLLVNIPQMIQKQVVEYLGVEDRLLFRATSHQFRSLVDKTSVFLEKLAISYGADWIRIKTSDGFNIKYCNVGNEDLKIKKNGKCFDLEESGGYISAAMSQFKRILDWEHLKIGELSIEECGCGCYEQDDKSAASFLENKISGVLENIKCRPNIEKLTYLVGELENVTMFLRHLEPKHLNIRRFFQPISFEIECDDMFDLEQWDRLESFTCDRVFEGDNNVAARYSHFNYAHFQLYHHFHVGEILKMKENLLLNPNLNQIKILTRFKHVEDFEKVNRLLKISGNAWKAEDPIWTHFQYPGRPKTERLSVLISERLIWFKGPKFHEDPPEKDPYEELDYERVDWEDSLIQTEPQYDEYEPLDDYEDLEIEEEPVGIEIRDPTRPLPFPVGFLDIV